MFKYLRYLHLLIAALSMAVMPVISYAFALPAPTLAPATPIAFPSAQSLPQPMGSGTAGVGKILSKVPGGQVAGVICMTINCSSTMAIVPQGIIPPAGWPTDQSGAPVPPSTASGTSQDVIATVAAGPSECTGKTKSCLDPGMQAWGASIGKPVKYWTDGPYWYYAHVFADGSFQIDWYGTIGGSTTSCPSGYSSSGSGCNLTDASAVQKPAGTPCQTILSNGQPHWDTSNPECASHGAGPYWTDSDGNKETLDTGNGTFSVVSGDGKTQTQVGPVSGNTTPITTTQTITDTDGKPHTVTTVTNLDSNGNVTNQTQLVDGIPITQENLDKLRNGTPSTSLPTDSTNSGTSSPAITCTTVGTCGVAQETTQSGILGMVTSIYKWLTGTSDLSTTTQPDYNPKQNDTSALGGIALPSLDLDWLNRIFPQPQCTDIQLDFQLLPNSHNDPMTIPVCKMFPPIRSGLEYFWYMCTAITVASILLETSPEPDMGNGKK